MDKLFIILITLAFFQFSLATGQDDFRLANMFTDDMVLKAGESFMIWGYAPADSRIGVEITYPNGFSHEYNNTASRQDNVWWQKVTGSLFEGFGYKIDVSNVNSNGEVQKISLNVGFGEVWVCSGQSNMEWAINGVRNSQEEIAAASNYENIRLTKVVRQISTEPLDEPLGYTALWMKPDVDYLTDGDSFSALCLLYGMTLADVFGEDYPIGLIDVSWGGTIIEAWSPPEALDNCGVEDTGLDNGANHNEYLWNALIHPFLKMSITGAIWYQGEQNAGYPGEYGGHNRDIYDCTFKSMIDSWRQRWSEASLETTDGSFPFGFVQLAPFTDQREHLAWPELRWKQTGNKGSVPNQVLQNVFMACAIDDDIDLHPKNKRLPAERLAWAALNLHYEYNEFPLNGPLPNAIKTNSSHASVEFSAELEPVFIEEDRFMVCCLASMDECDQVAYGKGWEGVNIVAMEATNIVNLDTSMACDGGHYSGLAYLWLETPCSGEAACPLYSADQWRLPVAPFKMAVN